MGNKCIYCLRSTKLTNSHIFPEGIGGKQELLKSVCEDCNGGFGRTIEAKVCEDLSFYRFMAQIKSKGKYATAPATLSIFGNEVGIRKIMRRGYPNYIPLIVVDEGPPRKYIQVAENPDKLRKYICALEKGGMHFDKTLSLVKEGTLTFSNELRDIASDDYLRLATKIAFERFLLFRSSQKCDDTFISIREFIIKGTLPETKFAFLFYEDIICNKLLPLSFPHHGILTFARGNLIASVVILFGLFYYCVILSTNAVLIMPWEDFVYIDPSRRKETKPFYKIDYPLDLFINLLKRSHKNGNALNLSRNSATVKFDLILQKLGMLANTNKAGGRLAPR